MLAGPLELTRRKKTLVWDDELEVAEELLEPPVDSITASPKASIITVPLPRRTRSHSSSGEFPPPMRRTSTDASGTPRPVSFSTKFQRVHPGTTGVTVLEHLERLDAVEASLQRLGPDDDFDEEVDVGVVPPPTRPIQIPGSPVASTSNIATSPFSPPGSPLATVHEVSSSASSIAEEDLAAMSKSTSHVEGLSAHVNHSLGGRGVEWMQPHGTSRKRTVIAEVCPDTPCEGLGHQLIILSSVWRSFISGHYARVGSQFITYFVKVGWTLL